MINAIKEEIQRQLQESEERLSHIKARGWVAPNEEQLIVHLKSLLSFIDTLEVKGGQEEPVSEELEEAAKHYLYSNILYDDVYVGEPTDKDCIEMFKAGANWQKEKDAKMIFNAKEEGYRLGKATMKQQLMNDAIDAEILEMPDNGNTFFEYTHLEIHVENLSKGKYGNGDKVKLIIIKEE